MKTYSPQEIKAGFSFSIPIQIKYSDIDGYMHVNNGIYFNYFEHARAMYLFQVCEWDILETGTVVANITMDYFKPIHVLDKPIAYVRCIKIGTSSFVLEQVLMGLDAAGEERVFASSTTTMVSVNMKTMKPTPIPVHHASKMKVVPQNQA
jgi:acyl-CoA thioester hydrolase